MSLESSNQTIGDLVPDLPKQNPHDDLGPEVLHTIWILLGISTIFVTARLFVKCKMIRRLYWDDLMVVISLALGLVHALVVTQSVRTGLGRHMFTIPIGELEKTLKTGFFSLAWGFLSPMAGRIAFLIFILWVSGTDPAVKRWPIYTFIVIQLVVNLAAIIVAYAQCGDHLDVLYSVIQMEQQPKYCWSPYVQTDYGYFSGSVNTLTDLFLTILPAIIIKHTKLDLKGKLEIASLLCLGFIAMIASIVKTYEAKMMSELRDETYDLVQYVLWISIELNTVLIVSSIPVLRPLFRFRNMSRISRPRRLQEERRDSVPMSVMTSTSTYPKKGKLGTRVDSVSSQEDILGSRSERSQSAMDGGITRTVEVTVTNTPNDVSWVHAALVGLPLD